MNADRGGFRHGHCLRRRVFIGPLPEKAISQVEAELKKEKGLVSRHPEDCDDSADNDDDVPDLVKKNNTFQFFLRHGGKSEDWGENEQSGLREEMKRRWRESEWATIWNRHRKPEDLSSPSVHNVPGAGVDRQWLGGSFEVGQFLGINILQDLGEEDRSSHPTHRQKSGVLGPQFLETQSLPVIGAVSSIHELSAGRPSNSAHASGSRLQPENGNGEYVSSVESGPHGPFVLASSHSTVSLLETLTGERSHPDSLAGARAVRSMPAMPSSLQTPAYSTSQNRRVDRKGKGKLVRITDLPEHEITVPEEISESLEGPSHILETSLASTFTFPESIQSDAVHPVLGEILRDRVLVRNYYSRDPVRSPFNEEVHKTTPNLSDPEWAEYLLVWRNNRLELYSDQRLPFVKRKRLSYTIPLVSPLTQLSVYSFVDLTFCLIRWEKSYHSTKNIFFSTNGGTSIFLFKLKCRSRAYDWIFLLWRQLGGQLPSAIDVRCPRLDVGVKIDVPTADEDGISKVFDRENVIALCTKALRTIPNWNNLIERQLKEGKTVELAWRVETHLDWIWLDDDVQGNRRRWEILAGLALRQSRTPAILELRIAEHLSTRVHRPNGERLDEPPAIEGFLDRIKPGSHARQPLYVSTHDGNMFVLNRHSPYPPSPPGFTPVSDSLESYAKSLRNAEAERAFKQIMHATGVADLRKILVVRRAVHPVYQPTHKETRKDRDESWFDTWVLSEPQTQEDEEDVGGDEGLAKAQDKQSVRMKRSFELLLTTGHVIRFEAYSSRVALEWIERLRALIMYWSERHRVDAKEEMDLASARHPRLTPRKRLVSGREYPPEPPPDASAPLPALGSLYNRCILEGCKPIVKGGKVFMRKGLYGQYKMVQLFLVTGHLVRFRIQPSSSLHPAMQRITHLTDAYICSGYLAAATLPEGQYVADAKVQPRRYQDGLETDDNDEEMLFLVWYWPSNILRQHASTSQPFVPSLSIKRKVLVFRTRSRLERDSWCFALNAEIEKITRAEGMMEDALRNTGTLHN